MNRTILPIAFLALLIALPLGAKEYEVCEQGNCVQSNAITSDNLGLDGRKFCPICKERGLKSSVYMLGCQSTLMAAYAYWDENGTYHYHDPNKTICHYRCSNGHEWSE